MCQQKISLVSEQKNLYTHPCVLQAETWVNKQALQYAQKVICKGEAGAKSRAKSLPRKLSAGTSHVWETLASAWFSLCS